MPTIHNTHTAHIFIGQGVPRGAREALARGTRAVSQRPSEHCDGRKGATAQKLTLETEAPRKVVPLLVAKIGYRNGDAP